MMEQSLEMHHIGIATYDIGKMKDYLKLFFEIIEESDIVFDPNQNAKVCMLTIKDGTKIELIEGEAVTNFVKKKRYLYHICYTTKDIVKTIDRFVENGSLLISQPKEALLFRNRKVAFLATEMGIIELLEKCIN